MTPLRSTGRERTDSPGRRLYEPEACHTIRRSGQISVDVEFNVRGITSTYVLTRSMMFALPQSVTRNATAAVLFGSLDGRVAARTSLKVFRIFEYGLWICRVVIDYYYLSGHQLTRSDPIQCSTQGGRRCLIPVLCGMSGLVGGKCPEVGFPVHEGCVTDAGSRGRPEKSKRSCHVLSYSRFYSSHLRISTFIAWLRLPFPMPALTKVLFMLRQHPVTMWN